MKKTSLSARYIAAVAQGAGSCPIEAGTIGRLRIMNAATAGCRSPVLPPCGCWPQEGAAVVASTAPRAGRQASERAA